MFVNAHFKREDGEVTVHSMHLIDAHSAAGRFPWDWSLDGKFAPRPKTKDGQAPAALTVAPVAPVKSNVPLV